MSNRRRHRIHTALLAGLLLLGGSAVVQATDYVRLIKVQVVNDTGATVTVAYGELESGVWDSQPVPGTAIAPDGTASFSTGVTDIFEPLDGSVSLSGAAGTAFDITWSWQLEDAADLSATVTAGSAATQIQAEDPGSDFPAYVVTLKKAAQ